MPSVQQPLCKRKLTTSTPYGCSHIHIVATCSGCWLARARAKTRSRSCSMRMAAGLGWEGASSTAEAAAFACGLSGLR
eukprot:8269088-Karenia_brevis.AAC.1